MSNRKWMWNSLLLVGTLRHAASAKYATVRSWGAFYSMYALVEEQESFERTVTMEAKAGVNLCS